MQLGAGDPEHAGEGTPLAPVSVVGLSAAQRQHPFQGDGPQARRRRFALPEGHGSKAVFPGMDAHAVAQVDHAGRTRSAG